MDNHEKLAYPSSQRTSQQLPVTMTQLLRASTQMHHIDEFLTWIAQLTTRNLNVQAMQFWANQAHSTKGTSVVLRAMAIQDQSLPPQIVMNARIIEAVEFLLKEQRGAELQHVYGAFVPHQADLLSRYGLNYCFAHFQSNASLLPPSAISHSSDGVIATPFAIIALLFWRHMPYRNSISSVSTILDRVESVAKQGNLLLPPDGNISLQPTSLNRVPQQRNVAVREFIPRRVQNSAAMREYSPFSTSTPIRGKEAQRLYQAIDGHKSLAELARLTKLDTQNMETALRLLVTQNLIQVCDKTGQPINGPWLLG